MPNSASSIQTEHSAYIDEKLPKPSISNNKLVYAVSITVAFFVLVIGYGLTNQLGFFSFLSRFNSQRNSIVLITSSPVDSDPTVLVVKRQKGHSEAFAMNAYTGAPLFFSKPDVDSFKPVRSPNGIQVAYFYEDENDKLAIRVGQPNQIFTDTVTVNTIDEADWKGFEICDYADIAWSTRGQQIATFICHPKSKEAYLLITQVGAENRVLKITKDDSNRVRTAVWADDHNIIYTKAENGVDVIYVLDVGATDPPRRLSP